MLLLGYNNGQSFRRRGLTDWTDFYSWDFMGKRFLAVLKPFTFIFVVQIVVRLLQGQSLSMGIIFYRFITGGYGPGSYFVPLTLQAYLILPFFYRWMKKYSAKKMLIVVAVINTAIEIACRIGNIDEQLYRVLVIRFIFALALGVALSSKSLGDLSIKRLKPWIGMSGIYIFLVMYLKIDLIMERYWHSQHLPGVFWALFLIILLCRVRLSYLGHWGIMIARLGRASFHIYLIQMFYFNTLQPYLLTGNLLLQAIVDVGLCLTIGYLFFMLERRFSQ